jgi:hypothetical protein
VSHHLVFGVDRDPGVNEPVGSENRVKNGKGRLGALKVNPMLAQAGPGPEGAKCGSCSHLFQQGGTSGTYYKCDLRRNTGGPATDHRVRWPACAHYQPEVG